jgi:DNA-binding SARP family transcriptional activator/ABC-type glycerol-3-phosphate transport system substrate-binding protein
VEFGVLGPLQVSRDGSSVPLGGGRQRMVLAALLTHLDEPVSADRLIDDVWGEEPPPTARKSLQVYISRLRRLLGEGAIEAVGSGYVLRIEPEQLDATRFERLAAEGRRLLPGDPAGAAAILRQALALWHGMPWGDLADEPALRADVERLRELRMAALEDRLEADLMVGSRAVVGELKALAASHPLRERLGGLLMLALYREGRQAEALRAYQDFRRRLGSELGIEPSSELQQLEDRILAQDPALLALTSSSEVLARSEARNPYKGLRPFGEADAGDFFGRESLTTELVARLADERFLAVLGPSGSGKSSVVRAGLIPALRSGTSGSGGWLIATMQPGSHPFEELEAALVRAAPEAPVSLIEEMRGDDLDLLRAVLRIRPDEDHRVLLVIDQFEELFLLVAGEDRRSRFIRNLMEAVEDPHSGLAVVLTMRADFFDRPLQYPALGARLVQGQVAVLPITASELGEAAVQPAARVGVQIEPDLTAELVSDVAREPGALPLFQFVLTELFEHRAYDILSLAEYRELGGLRGALSRRSEQLFEGLEAEQREVARHVLLRLVSTGGGRGDTRRRIRRVELDGLDLDRTALDEVLRRFGLARLLTFDRDAVTGEPTVEFAHEALLQEWPRLRGWIDEVRRDLDLHRSLTSAAAEWIAAARHPDYLLAGRRLALFDGWTRSAPIPLTEVEVEYLSAGRDRRERDLNADTERRERERSLERRAVRRLRSLAAVLALATILGAVLTGFALEAGSEASRQAEEARRARDQQLLAAQTIRVKELTSASVAVRTVDPQLSLLLGLHAVNVSDAIQRPVAAETIGALHWALQAQRVPYPLADGPTAVLAGPDGRRGVFLMDLPELLALARESLSRELTPAECASYFEPGVCPRLPAAFSAGLDAQPIAPLPADSGRPLAGTRVNVMGPFEAGEAVALRADLARFTERTGIAVEYDMYDTEDRLRSRLEAGNPPDLALIPQPGLVAWLAGQGAIIDLGSYVDLETLRYDQSPHVVSLGTVADDGTWPSDRGGFYGGLVRLNVKSLIWYPVPEFDEAGYEVPTTWEELVTLTERIVEDGRVPWCHGEGAGLASGWPGTDWIEDLVLHAHGASVYDRWVTHQIPFDDPAIRSAWERLDAVVLADGHVFGGRDTAATLPFWVAQHPMFDDPPGCWLYHQASFGLDFLPFGVDAERDTAFFRFPAIDPQHSSAVVGGGDFVVAFNDRPEVREVLRYLLSPDFGVEMARVSPGSIFANRRFPVDAYQICEEPDSATRSCRPNDLTRHLAQIANDALEEDTFRFDGSDLMPVPVSVEFWMAMVEYVGGGPDNLDELLARLESAWVALEQGAP